MKVTTIDIARISIQSNITIVNSYFFPNFRQNLRKNSILYKKLEASYDLKI